MKHVVWEEGSRGAGVDRARAVLRAYYRLQLETDRMNDLAATGPFDAQLRGWVKRFQFAFNRSKHPAAQNFKLPEHGEIDWRTRSALNIDENLAPCDDSCRNTVHLPENVVADSTQLTAIEVKARRKGEAFIGSAYRVRNLARLLAVLGLTDQRVGSFSTKRIAPLYGEGYFLVPKGDRLYGDAIPKSECAALPQALKVSNTSQWRRGPRVQDVDFIAPGTVIATLQEGVYLSDYSGKSHVGIFLAKNKDGLIMLDQWIGEGGDLGIRFRRFNLEPGKPRAFDAARYFFDPTISYRKPVVKDGETFWRHDHSFATVSHGSDVISNGSAYYIVLDDGNVARRDLPDVVPRTAEDTRQAGHAMVNQMFEGFSGDLKRQGDQLREALEGLKPTPAPGAGAPPR
jgi:hypothetical protein